MKKRIVTLMAVFSCLFASQKAAAQFSSYGNEGQIAEKVVTALNDAKYDDVRSYFALLYKNAVPREMIAQNWEGIQSILGNFQRVKSVTKVKNTTNGYDVIR